MAFENTDADEMAAEFMDYLPQEDIALFCYWIDKKLIQIPRIVMAAHAFEEYVERHEFDVDTLIVLRQTLDPEAVSAMIHKAVERLVPRRIWVVSVLSTDSAQERLLDMLPVATAANVRFRRFQAREYGDEIFRKSAYSTGDNSDESGNAIQQIDRKFFMPKLIESRMRPRPSRATIWRPTHSHCNRAYPTEKLATLSAAASSSAMLSLCRSVVTIPP